MQPPPRCHKSQLLLSISIILVSALIIATIVVKPPVNYGLVFRSSADAGNTSNSNNSNNLTKPAVVVRTNRTYYMHTNTKSKNQLANLENSIDSTNNNNNSFAGSILKTLTLHL